MKTIGAAGVRTFRNVSSDHLDGQSLSVVSTSVPECVSFDNHQESHTDSFFSTRLVSKKTHQLIISITVALAGKHC